jgi:hypothetical protein
MKSDDLARPIHHRLEDRVRDRPAVAFSPGRAAVRRSARPTRADAQCSTGRRSPRRRSCTKAESATDIVPPQSLFATAAPLRARMSARQTARSPRPAGSWIRMYPPARRPAAGHRLDLRRRQCVESAHCSPARQAQTIDPLSARQRGNVDCYYVLCDKMPKMKKKAPPKRLVAYHRVSTIKQVGSGLGIGAQTATVESAPPSSGEDRCDLYGGRERQAIRATGVDERSTSRPDTARAQQNIRVRAMKS